MTSAELSRHLAVTHDGRRRTFTLPDGRTTGNRLHARRLLTNALDQRGIGESGVLVVSIKTARGGPVFDDIEFLPTHRVFWSIAFRRFSMAGVGLRETKFGGKPTDAPLSELVSPMGDEQPEHAESLRIDMEAVGSVGDDGEQALTVFHRIADAERIVAKYLASLAERTASA